MILPFTKKKREHHLIVHQSYDLSVYNTMSLACTAQVAIELHHLTEIPLAISYAKTHHLPLFILSFGSNVLLPLHLNACVLLPKFEGIEILEETDSDITIKVAGGINWHSFVIESIAKGWYGLENLALIPGLVGACAVQNIGAYGVQVSDSITQVFATELITGKHVVFDNSDCQFGYRHSIFKEGFVSQISNLNSNHNRHLITHIAFKLHKNPACTLTEYGDLAVIAQKIATKRGKKAPTPLDTMHAVIHIRQSKLPDPKVLPNCGSFFTNPIITISEFMSLKAKFPNLPSYPISDTHIKLPAGWLIDQAGLKGKGIFPILTHEHQALVLTNHAKLAGTSAYQADILATESLIVQSVQALFGISLVREPALLA